MSTPEEVQAHVAVPIEVEVFWRPGCPYCSSLRSDLSRRGVAATWRNIWQDEDARAQVRAANSGNETVPTVRVGTQVLTNPSGARVAKLAGLGDGPAGARAGGLPVRWLLSLLPVVVFVIAGVVLARTGHGGWSLGVEALAVGVWWLTRPLRR